MLVTAAYFVILGGVEKKTVCACLGTLAGITLAAVFGLAAQSILRIDGYRQEYAEALLQPRQLLSSPYISLEAVSAIASSAGVMLAVPLTAAICALAYGKKMP